MYKLTKGSADSFEITTESLDIILEILESYVCSECMLFETDAEYYAMSTSEQIQELWGTPCGAEFIFEENAVDPYAPPKRYWSSQPKLGGYLVTLRVLDFEVNDFINRDHWTYSGNQEELVRVSIGRLQRKMFDAIFPTWHGRFKCDWDY